MSGGCPSGRARGEDGITLVELLVAATLTAVIIGAAYGAMIVMSRSLLSSDIQTDNVDQLRTGIATVSRDLRAASEPRSGTPAFEVAEEDVATFFTRVGPTVELAHIDLRVVDGELRHTRTPVGFNADGEVELLSDEVVERTIARGVITDVAVLRYLDENGAELTDLDQAAERRRIRAVEVRLRAATDGAVRVRPTELTTTVRLPNLQGAA